MISRKNLIVLLVTGLILTIASCNDEEFHTLGIDLTNDYNQEQVKVILDSNVLLNKSLQSDLSTSVATTLRVKKTSGKYSLKVIINDTLEKTETIAVKDDLYVFIKYNPIAQEILFSFSNEPVLYN